MAPQKRLIRIPRRRKKEKVFKLVEEDAVNIDNDDMEEEIIEIDDNNNQAVAPQIQPIVIYPPPQQSPPNQPVPNQQPQPRPLPLSQGIQPPQQNPPIPPPIQPPPPVAQGIQPAASIIPVQQPLPIPVPIQPPPTISQGIQSAAPFQKPSTRPPIIVQTRAPTPQPMQIQPMIVYPQPLPAMFPPPWFPPSQQFPPFPPYPPPPVTIPRPKPRARPTTIPSIGNGVNEIQTTISDIGNGVKPKRKNPRNGPSAQSTTPSSPNSPQTRSPLTTTSSSTTIGTITTTDNSTLDNTTAIFSNETVKYPSIGDGIKTTSLPKNITDDDFNFDKVTDPISYNEQPQKLDDTECCISLSTGWLTIGIFMFLSILILLACLYCMYYFRKKEKQKCKDAVKQYNDIYRQNSKMPNFNSHFMPPTPAIMTPQVKMDQLMKNMTDNPHQITTDERSIAGILNYLADNPIEHDVIYRPGRQDVVLCQKEIPSHLKSIPNYQLGSAKEIKLPESSQLADRERNDLMVANEKNEKDKQNQKKDMSLSKKGSQSLKRIKDKLLNRNKSDRKAAKPSSPPPLQQQQKKQEQKDDEPKNVAYSPNPRRSKDRVVFHEGKHHRLQ